ncbi:MAG: glutathione S-transferase family protein [Steroidobacteraceae bacterium]
MTNTLRPSPPQMTLFYSPRACSLACHIALEESGLPFTAHAVRIRAGEHESADYRRINPWGKIPALRIGDEVLTEAHAILTFIGELAPPELALIPTSDPLQRARAHEWMNFLSSTVHIAFRPLFRPQSLLGAAELHPKLREVGVPTLRKTLSEVDSRLAAKTWALGERYSVCDPYLLVFYIWSQREDVIEYAPDLPNWRALAERMFARPATERALAREGLTRDSLKLR